MRPTQVVDVIEDGVHSNRLPIKKYRCDNGKTYLFNDLADAAGVSRPFLYQKMRDEGPYSPTLFQKKSQGRKKGNAAGNWKLDRAKVREIRSKSGLCTRKLAKQYGVTRATICDVLSGRTWKEIN